MTLLSLILTPSGHLIPNEGEDNDRVLADDVAERIREAFAGGSAAGLLHLGTVELETPLPPLFSFWRNLARTYLTELCLHAGVEEPLTAAVDPPPPEEIARLIDACPPMQGFEYLNSGVMEDLWRSLDAYTRDEIIRDKSDAQTWLKHKNSLWNMVGRVTFHLAENRKDESRPFAFLVTYTARLSGMARPQYLPLGKALTEFSEARDRRGLLALLTPLQRGAEKSALVRELVESGEIFHPLAWTPREAYRFLKDIPSLESSGIMIRIPDWWRAHGGRPARPRVKVTIGDKKKTGLGLDALLDFSVRLSLDGEEITPEEWRAILESTSGLVLLRGKWVEIDREKLADLLAFWKKTRAADFRDGIQLGRAMRLLSGAGLGDKEAAFSPDAYGDWQQVAAGRKLAEILKDLRSPEGITAADPKDLLKTDLRGYQRTGVNWLRFMCRLGLGACLADDMGLGKTIQVLALMLLLKEEMAATADDAPPFLLVVPASLVANWKAEARRFAPSLSIFFAHPSETPSGDLTQLDDAQTRRKMLAGVDLVITSYALLQRRQWPREIAWELIVLDEAQAIKNPAARQSRAVKALQGKNRLALSGTPVENRLGDLWSLFDFLSPGLLGSAAAFNRYVKRISAQGDGAYAALRTLVRPYILRRLKSDRSIISDLPDKVEVTAYCTLSKTQAALYDQSVRRLAAELKETDGIRRRGIVLAYLLRLKQICNHPSQWLGDQAYTPEDSGKFRRLLELCEEIQAKQEKVLIFSQFREMTNPLAEVLAQVFGRKGLVLHGQTQVKKRRELIDAFQQEDGPPFFVLSLKAGGVGLNLTAASHVIHFDRWWNPAVENQATDRAYRIGQHKNIMVHKFVCRGTIEEKIDALIEEKKDLAENVLGAGGEKLLTEMPDEELLKFISLDLSRATEQ